MSIPPFEANWHFKWVERNSTQFHSIETRLWANDAIELDLVKYHPIRLVWMQKVRSEQAALCWVRSANEKAVFNPFILANSTPQLRSTPGILGFAVWLRATRSARLRPRSPAIRYAHRVSGAWTRGYAPEHVTRKKLLGDLVCVWLVPATIDVNVILGRTSTTSKYL